METYLTLMLVRFGLIAAGVVVLGLVAFGVAVALRRRGYGERVRRGVDQATRFAGRVLDERRARGIGPAVAREALRRYGRGR